MKKNVRRYTLLSTMGCFFSLICKSFTSWRVTLSYGVLIAAFSWAFGLVHLCNPDNRNCFVAVNLSLILLIFITMLLYLYDFYQVMFKNSVFKPVSIVKLDKNKLKSVGVLLGYILCFAVSAFISWKIFTKPANPNWKIEGIYFTIFFIFCMIPVFAMRFSAVVAFYFNECKLPSFGYLYKKTSGRSYIGIVGFLAVLLILSVLNLYLQGATVYLLKRFPLSFTVSILGSLLNALIILITFGLFLCFFEAQRQKMIEEDVSEESVLHDAEIKKDSLPSPKSSKKTKGKKQSAQKNI